MIRDHYKIYDHYLVESGKEVTTSSSFDRRLARYDQHAFYVRMEEGAGNLQSFKCWFDHSGDGSLWHPKLGDPWFEYMQGGTWSNNQFKYDTGTSPTLDFARLRFVLTGTGVIRVRLRVWVTARDLDPARGHFGYSDAVDRGLIEES
jgi:hypothetical protein